MYDSKEYHTGIPVFARPCTATLTFFLSLTSVLVSRIFCNILRHSTLVRDFSFFVESFFYLFAFYNIQREIIKSEKAMHKVLYVKVKFSRL